MTEPKQHISPSVLRQKADNGRTLMLSPQVLRELAEVRNPLYAQAPIRVPSNNVPHDMTVRAILEAIGK